MRSPPLGSISAFVARYRRWLTENDYLTTAHTPAARGIATRRRGLTHEYRNAA
jgi:hypothetical protein